MLDRVYAAWKLTSISQQTHVWCAGSFKRSWRSELFLSQGLIYHLSRPLARFSSLWMKTMLNTAGSDWTLCALFFRNLWVRMHSSFPEPVSTVTLVCYRFHCYSEELVQAAGFCHCSLIISARFIWGIRLKPLRYVQCSQCVLRLHLFHDDDDNKGR